MPKVNVQDCSSFEMAYRRFKRSCEKAGIHARQRMKQFYEKPTTKRKRAKAAAIKRYAKKLQKRQQILENERTRY